MTWGDVRDAVLVGGGFGLVGGVIACGVVGAFAATPWWKEPFGRAIVPHLLYIPLYGLAGTVICLGYPFGQVAVWRRRGLWLVASAMFSLTITSAAQGPCWSWGPGVWGRWLVTTVLLAMALA